MTKVQVRPNRPVYPTPAALITCADEAGKPNIITLGEVFNISISRPVILGIAIRKSRYSHELISRTREYVVNMPTRAIADQVWACGRISGREVDKFQAAGLTPVPAAVARAPLIAECPINVECRVTAIQAKNPTRITSLSQKNPPTSPRRSACTRTCGIPPSSMPAGHSLQNHRSMVATGTTTTKPTSANS